MWKRISLPTPLSRCYVHGETIVAVCQGGQLIYWGWDGVVEELTPQLPALEKQGGKHKHKKLLFGGVPGVLFHPTDTRILFLVWMYSCGTYEEYRDTQDADPRKFTDIPARTMLTPT